MKHSLLVYLANKAGLFSKIKMSTSEIAQELNISQQSVSRLLIDLERENKIARTPSPEGIKIVLQEQGIKDLKEEFLALKKIFQAEKNIKGRPVEGFNQGRYYVQKYKKKIKEILGFEPYLGTLNLKTDPAKVKSFLLDLKPVQIEGFRAINRSFGGVELFKIKVNNLSGAILRPERTRHDPEIIEVVAGVNLRDKLKLNKNSVVKISKS